MMSSFQVVDSSPGSSLSIMETSNFAHVIFQNVGKSFQPQAPLECSYTLTPYITPHPKDWVGIFKVGWSTARDYYTFLWSPMPEHYEPGSAMQRTVVFQGYYVPKSDGEFYQFCYVTHTGDIRGASTPFLFKPSTPNEELLTVAEDDGNSDILVVTTKTGLLEQRVEEAQQERRDLLMAMRLLQEEKQQLQEEQTRLSREREQERESCGLLRSHNQELLRSSQGLSEEREEVRRRLSEATDRIRQLEDDLRGVSQRSLQKETELDCLRERLKKLTADKDSLESQLKTERDERDRYKAHLRSTELENTKLSAELQMLKAVELNREVTIAQFQEELDRLRACVAQRDNLEKELHTHQADKAELGRVREQLRQAEGQLQTARQQASLLASELRDSSGARDRIAAELYCARLEAEKLRASLADAQAECRRAESQLDRMRSSAHTEVSVGAGVDGVSSGEAGTSGRASGRASGSSSAAAVSEAEAELQREVEELKLRLHMAAEHYKEKYRECQRLRRQVAKLSEAQGEPKRNAATETTQEPLAPSLESPTAESFVAAVLRGTAEMTIAPEVEDLGPPTRSGTSADTRQEERRVEGEGPGATKGSKATMGPEGEEKEEEGQELKTGEEGKRERPPEESLQMTSWVEVEKERRSAEENEEDEEEEVVKGRENEEEEAEKEQRCLVEEELATMEEKWKEQCAINETLRQRLASEEERFLVQIAERVSEVMELKRRLAQALRDKELIQEELRRCVSRQREQREEEATRAQGTELRQPVVLRYPLPYPQDPSPPPLVPHQPAELQFGNPYSTDSARGRAVVTPSPEQTSRPPPCAPPVTTPACATAPDTAPGAASGAGGAAWDTEVVCIQPSRGMSPPNGLENPPEEPPHVGDGAQPACAHQSGRRNEARGSFCFDSSEVHKRCPLCEVIFPPHFEQRTFEQHVESHWKVCPVCSEQFPLNCQQQLFERHVLTHFDGHVLNFEQID